MKLSQQVVEYSCSHLYRASLEPRNDVMVTPLTKFNWYLGFCFIYANTCVPAAIIATLFRPLNRELNFFRLLILSDAPRGTILILTEVSDSIHPE